MILALDLGTNCGWAMLRDEDIVRSGVWDLALEEDQADGHRFLRLWQLLTKAHGEQALELVAFERSMVKKGAHAVEIYAGLKAITEAFCAARSVRCVSVHTGTLKKHITGSGRAEKPAMRDVAQQRWGRRIDGFDEADALCVLSWAVDQLQTQGAA